jgi:hypothetical protein
MPGTIPPRPTIQVVSGVAGKTGVPPFFPPVLQRVRAEAPGRLPLPVPVVVQFSSHTGEPEPIAWRF